MRRRQLSSCIQFYRWACTLASLVKTQRICEDGKTPSRDAAAKYVRFFNIQIPTGAKVEEIAKELVRCVKKEEDDSQASARRASAETVDFGEIASSHSDAHSPSRGSSSSALNAQHMERRCPSLLHTPSSSSSFPIFFAALNTSCDILTLYSIQSDEVVLNIHDARIGDSWDLADELLRATNSVPYFAIVPITDTGEREKAALSRHLNMLACAVRKCGLLAITHVDIMELANCFMKNPPPLHMVLPSSGTDRSTHGAPHELPEQPCHRSNISSSNRSSKSSRRRMSSSTATTPNSCATLSSSPSPPCTASSSPPPMVLPPAYSTKWFRAHWIYLRILASRSSFASSPLSFLSSSAATATATCPDPFKALRICILPPFDVFVVHLVRTGSVGVINLSVWDAKRRRSFSAKGMLSDILSALLATHSTQMIFVPTFRTDRATLFRCRAALQKAGVLCVFVFAAELDERCRVTFRSDPRRYWHSLLEATHSLETDFLFHISIKAGNTMRSYHQKLLSEPIYEVKSLQEKGLALMHGASAQQGESAVVVSADKADRGSCLTKQGNTGGVDADADADADEDAVRLTSSSSSCTAPSYSLNEDDSTNKAMADTPHERHEWSSCDTATSSGCAHMTRVEQWLRIFVDPARQRAEAQERAHYDAALYLAYTATDYTVYGQPHNPVSSLNYVLAAGLMDEEGHCLQPWAKYTARGQFQLPCLKRYRVLVTHNAKHLLLLIWDDAELQSFLQRGGRVWCTMLGEYLLEAQRCRTGSNDLREVALRHGVLLPPSSLLGQANDALALSFHRAFVTAAVVALRTITDRQLHRARAQSQLLSCAHRMDALLAMAAMEHAGIRIDRAEALTQSRALHNAARVLDTALEAFVPPEVPQDMRMVFDWTSLQHLHAYFFGGRLALGQVTRARDSATWLSHLVHLCHRFGPFDQYVSELHLQRYAAQCAIGHANKNDSSGHHHHHHHRQGGGGSSSRADAAGMGFARLPQRIARYIEACGSQKDRTYRVLVCDVETTGLNVASDQIIEVAFYDPQERTCFASVVNPHRPITPRTIEIHHITDAEAQRAPGMDVVAPGMAAYLRLTSATRRAKEVTVVLGHNVFALDEPMLRRAFELHCPEVDLDEVVFCDSLMILKALKLQLRLHRAHTGGHHTSSGNDRPHSRRGGGAAAAAAADHASLLDTLTASLRLSDLMAKLNLTLPGQLHRADTDAKALWLVLVNALGMKGKPASAQAEAVLRAAATTLLAYPGVGCFVPAQRRRARMEVRLPGVVHRFVSTRREQRRLAQRVFGESVLRALSERGAHVASLLLQRMQLDRHTSRFLRSAGEGRFTALHTHDESVHQHIDLTATTTSRTTSAFPSCQNIPKDDKSAMRRLFVSRFGAHGRCVEVDYSQLEIVVLAILSRDARLIRELNEGVDFHIKRASFFSGLPYAEIEQGCRRGVGKYIQLRQTAKKFSFQRLYGAGVRLLHRTTGISIDALRRTVAQEDREYPGIAQWHRTVRAVALRAENPGLPTSFVVELPTGLRVSFRTRDVILNLPPVKNYPIQSYGAELAQMMLGRLFRHFAQKSFYGQRAFLTNFVHDSVWMDCHVSCLEECVRETCAILSDVQRYVEQTFPGVRIAVPMRVSVSCGVDMHSMQRVENMDFSFLAHQRRSVAESIVLDLDSEEDVMLAARAEDADADADEAGEGEGEGEADAEGDEEEERDEEARVVAVPRGGSAHRRMRMINV